MNKDTDIAMHKEHRSWESDIEMWNYDVELWKEEIKSLKGALINIEVLIEDHEDAVAKHVDVFKQHQTTVRVHEQNIGLQLPDSDTLKEQNELHENERISHQLLIRRHNQLKYIQHEIMTLTKEFNDRLENITIQQDK